MDIIRRKKEFRENEKGKGKKVECKNKEFFKKIKEKGIKKWKRNDEWMIRKS